MPHITVFHSIDHITANLNKQFLELHEEIAEKTGIDVNHIKSRAIPYTYGAIAKSPNDQYVHVEVSLKVKKDQETKNKIGDIVTEFIKEVFDTNNVVEVTVEVREFDPAVYFKWQKES